MYEKIKMLCKEKGISIRTLESACGLSHGSVSKWDKHEPSHGKLYTVADYLGVSVNYLLSEKTATADNAVQISEHPEVYYLDDDTREIAEFYHKNPQYRVLLDASRKIRPEDIDFVRQFLEKFGGDE